jgi:hypothetical protein
MFCRARITVFNVNFNMLIINLAKKTDGSRTGFSKYTVTNKRTKTTGTRALTDSSHR